MSFKKIALRTTGLGLNILTRINAQKAGKWGLDLFCLPMAKKLKAHQKSYLLNACHKTLDVHGQKVQTYRWGNGAKKILFVHGWASHSYRWKLFVELLKEGDYSIYALDAPGHGLSGGRMLTLPLYSEIIETFTREIGPWDAIVGHSFGGYAIINWLHQHPQSPYLKAAILAAPGEVEDFMQYHYQLMKLSKASIRSLENEFQRRVHKKPSDFSAALLAKDFTYPCLIVHDEEDKDASAAYSKRLHKVWSNSQLILTKGLGHSLKSIELTKTILQFLRS
ncbi:MAG: alpha/beta hydrolase [Chitinophagales bacterium]|nr:alpha/beta hydrolase [Chitinophagales bacterium]